ncbi:MAG: 4-hydroxy-tetrahydrodipicolinate synthase [Holosporales bacterium]|jgi:4-hydroxy-tetrahydrodipicolinate synthase|nr:4-hydroxy-tetrahydrodipicolinate synthase [Holosporales bacterium]
MKIAGSIVALVTPIHDDKVDLPALQELVAWHSSEGTDGIVIVGSTGEGSLLSEEERIEVMSTAVAQNRALANPMQTIAGCGTISTKETINMVQHAEKCGVDAVMVVSPSYIRPSQEGLRQHFGAVAQSVGIPVILYNHPGRTGVNVSNATLVRICNENANVVGIKDSNPDLSRIAELRAELPARVSLLSGDDSINIGFLAQGGEGMVSVTANLFPRLCKKFMQAWNGGDAGKAFAYHKGLLPVHKAMSCESNPIAVVYGLSTIKKGVHNEVRAPLLPIAKGSASAGVIDAAVQEVLQLQLKHEVANYKEVA